MRITKTFLERLSDTTRQFAELRVPAPLQEYILDAALELFQAETAALLFLEDDGRVGVRLLRSRLLPEAEIPGSASIQDLLKNVIQRGQSLVVSDASAAPGLTLISVSLVARQQTIGALYLARPLSAGAFQQTDVPAARLYASHAAIALHNALLNADLETRLAALNTELQQETDTRHKLLADLARMAATDNLTGAYSRQHFFTLAANELERALRYGRPLSVITYDLDRFKMINDTYGHAVGDQVLVEVTQRIQAALRSNDILCRTGGEEFAIVLPETDEEHAEMAADRLRQHIASRMVETAKGQVAVTISLGITSIRTRSMVSMDILLAEADQALYAAKLSGRNKAAASRLLGLFNTSDPTDTES